MVKHVILWKLKEEFSDEEKKQIKVRIDCLPSSTVDVMLDTTFESAEALKAYSVHPKHVAVADSKVRPYTAVRSCMDYEI